MLFPLLFWHWLNYFDFAICLDRLATVYTSESGEKAENSILIEGKASHTKSLRIKVISGWEKKTIVAKRNRFDKNDAHWRRQSTETNRRRKKSNWNLCRGESNMKWQDNDKRHTSSTEIAKSEVKMYLWMQRYGSKWNSIWKRGDTEEQLYAEFGREEQHTRISVSVCLLSYDHFLRMAFAMPGPRCV